MKYIWIDPPEGWKYGFPKLMPMTEIDGVDWLMRNGYPKKLITDLGKHLHIRYWEPTQEEINENL